MTDILFIDPTEDLTLRHEANGTLLLATELLQAGFEVKVLRFAECDSFETKDYHAFIQEITDKILQISPKCVSFYTLWPNYHVMLRIAKVVKEHASHIITVFGGPQASTTAEATMEKMDYVDYLCSGEGELTVVPFFKTLLEENGANLASIPGLYYRENGKVVFHNLEIPLCDLNTLPNWDRRLCFGTNEPLLGSKNYFMPIDAGRGCPYSCTFCCSSYFWRRMYRLKSPEKIVEDIRYFKENFGINSFFFSHDAFTTNQALVAKVCDHLIESGLNIQWRCTARVDCITEELVLKMKKAGMTQIDLGVETGSQRMQKLINKNLSLERTRKMIQFLLDNKIHVGLFFMYGFPQETEEDLNQTLELAFSLVDAGVRHASMSFCRFTPKSALTEEYYNQLVFDPDMKILFRFVYGFDEEIDIIRQNKDIFPFYCHLNTPVRNEYRDLYFLMQLYLQFPNSIRYLRQLYKGDNLKFYRDFYYNNLSCFQQGAEYAEKCVLEQPLEMMDNMLKEFDLPYLPQLRALLEFVHDARKVSHSEEDITIQKTYNFSYIDLTLKRPIEEYTPGKTEILLKKIGGTRDMKVLNISPV